MPLIKRDRQIDDALCGLLVVLSFFGLVMVAAFLVGP